MFRYLRDMDWVGVIIGVLLIVSVLFAGAGISRCHKHEQRVLELDKKILEADYKGNKELLRELKYQRGKLEIDWKER